MLRILPHGYTLEDYKMLQVFAQQSINQECANSNSCYICPAKRGCDDMSRLAAFLVKKVSDLEAQKV